MNAAEKAAYEVGYREGADNAYADYVIAFDADDPTEVYPAALADLVDRLEARIKDLMQRRTELQQANTRYVEGARHAVDLAKEATDNAEWWRGESLRWAEMFGTARQRYEELERHIHHMRMHLIPAMVAAFVAGAALAYLLVGIIK